MRDMTSNGKRNIDFVDLTEDNDDHRFSRPSQQRSAKVSRPRFHHEQQPFSQSRDFISSSQSSLSSRGKTGNEHSFTPFSQSSATSASQSAPGTSQAQDWSPPNTQAVIEDEARAADLVVGSQDFDDGDYDNYEFYGIYQSIPHHGLSFSKMGFKLVFFSANNLPDTIHAKIVGVRFYSGQATTGEYVAIRREPGNRYDSNAIRVDNVMGAQIGHIPRFLASKLASYMVCGPFSIHLDNRN